MDVTFTNVLEGARQYFQGLPPAAASTTVGGGANGQAPPPYSTPPTQRNNNNETEQQQSIDAPPPSSSSQQQQQQQQSYWLQPRSDHYNNQYQFPRPQSRDAPSNQYGQYHQRVATPTSQYQMQQQGYYPVQQQQQQQQQKTYYQMQSKGPEYYKQYGANRAGPSLPPIVSLALIGGSGYQQGRSVVSKPQQQQQQQVTNPVSASDYRYANQNRLPNQQQQQQQYQYPVTSTTYSTYNTQSSQYYQPKPIVTSTTTTTTTTANVNGRLTNPRQKRESPLDLSVKTIRTPADSTLDDEDRKYYHHHQQQHHQQQQRTVVNYPNYVNYNNNNNTYQNQRNVVSNRTTTQSASAPKVEFQPNFNVGTMMYNRRQQQQQQQTTDLTNNKNYQYRYPTVSVPTSAHVNSYIQQTNQKRELPRVDYQPQKTVLYQHHQDLQKKRPAEPVQNIIPNKMTKVDDWRQKLDQQIEQKFNSYQQQQAKNKALVNGNTYQQQQQQQQPRPSYTPRQYPPYHTQTYIPSATPHQYPNYPVQSQQAYQRPTPRLPLPPSTLTGGGADKRVISLLRNSLEIKEAQRKLEKEGGVIQQPRLVDVQHPSTDVTAPLQPRPAYARHNVSPFTPTNLPDHGVMYKLHLPKAIDSVIIGDSGKLDDHHTLTTHHHPHHHQTGDLDGLAALVAARIRTKAELKQVEQVKAAAPRRRLFSRNEEDGVPGGIPPRDKTGMRSSSETSVFDFPDSDSEVEMPVLERQTLGDMRRDRRSSTKPSEMKPEPRTPSPLDDAFAHACDSFVEQLKSGSGKKRGRRKKIEAEVLAKLESVVTRLDETKTVGGVIDEDDIPLAKCKKEVINEEEKVVASTTTTTTTTTTRIARKPTFGDGSHFYPGWEEEVYEYKKSLRMPASLIHVTRPPQCHRLSTSLPDLDPPYPPSPFTNNKIKTEDSDLESERSFNVFSKTANYDSEGSSSSAINKDSILDRLLERYGNRKKKKVKRRDDPSRTLPKSTEKNELLATPGYEKEEDRTKADFRQKTIENFKDVFLAKSERKKKQRNATNIKEVFGEDRPASAPPVTCLDVKIKQEIEDDEDDLTLNVLIKKEKDEEEFGDTKQVLKNKLLSRSGRKENLLKTLVDKKIKNELMDDEIDDDDLDSKSETPSIDDDESNHSSTFSKKRSKFRNIRRKFSSGFDYIRKKKKQKKDQDDGRPKCKGKFSSAKMNPCSIQDIQKEIKGWVLNKGIGETILHRAARLGYTDIIAYCLEKTECSTSPKDNAGYTPLHEASTKGNLAIAKMLLLYGANVSESARGGIRPLHEAAENGYVEIVRLLLSYGADPMLATYSGMTPLALCSDDTTTKLLQDHINDIEGKPGTPWSFTGPATCFDPIDTGFDPLVDVPLPSPLSDEEELEFEVSDSPLPNLYTLRGEPPTERWLLLQDLSAMLKIKSRDALLKQIATPPSSPTAHHKNVLRELKMSDFLEQAHCCHLFNIGEKVNTRASKIALVKYTDKVRELLGAEKVTMR